MTGDSTRGSEWLSTARELLARTAPALAALPSLRQQLDALRAGRAVVARGTGDLLQLSGADALDLLQRLSASDLSGAAAGQTRAAVFTDEKGRIVDVALLTAATGAWWLLAGQGRGEPLAKWIDRYVIMEDVHVSRCEASHVVTCVLADGPLAAGAAAARDDLLALCEPAPWGQLLHLVPRGELASPPPGSAMPPLPLALTPTSPALTPASADAFARWCVEVGRLRPGLDLDDDLNPLEAGLSPWISLTKGCFIGQEVIARLANYDKVRRRRARLLVTGTPPPKGATLRHEGREVGWVILSTPVEAEPAIHGQSAALAVVHRELEIETTLDVAGGATARLLQLFDV